MKTFNVYRNEICNHQPMPGKTCYCYNCRRWFHSLGIARHRAMHRDRKEDCTILDAGAGSITYCNFKEAQNDQRTNP